MPPLLRLVQHLLVFISRSVSYVDLVISQRMPLLAKDIQEIEQLVRTSDITSFVDSDLPAYIDAVNSLGREGIDDRFMLLEKLVVVMSRLPEGSPFAKNLEHALISILYADLPHPPNGYLSLPEIRPAEVKRLPYAFRTPDGSFHNILFPSLGRARSPYARSVPSTTFPTAPLPDAGLVFDTLLRRDKFEPHPGGLSSLFFAFANLIIHSIFDTDHHDCTINNASSYLDLSPLYGSSAEKMDQVRRKDGTGKLWEDIFADSRLLLMPPSVGALTILFCRNHNFIADQILSINERGSFSSPPPTEGRARLIQDDELFHRARLINCGFFMQIILQDYIGAILGLVRDSVDWRLNPLQTIRAFGHDLRPCGQGNVVSIEFNFLYRWHATLSSQDTQWVKKEFRKLFGPNVNFRTIEVDALKHAVGLSTPKSNVREWTFNNLKRDENGRYGDKDLVEILRGAASSPAGAFRARGTPEVFRVVEILAIEQGRKWGTCSLNEFREFMGLRPYKNFKEWNPLPEIHIAAEKLYKDIGNLELHVGLQAEETKKPGPGAGLCPGYTISRAILADAVCLTRGDRFLTTEFTPFNLTSWGYQYCLSNGTSRDPAGMLPRLLSRTLQSFDLGQSQFPFLVPH